MDILTIMLPVFLIIAAGVFLRRKKIITDHSARLLNILAYNIALPALIFSSIAKFRITELFDWKVIAALFIASILISLIAWFVARKIPARTASAFTISSFHSNTIYLGFPIILGAYGAIGLAKAGIIVALLSPFYYLLSLLALKSYQHKNKHGSATIKDPIFIACLLGIIASYFALELPVAITTTLNIVGGMALPIALVCLGACMHFDKIKHKLGLNFALAALKLVLMPLLCYLLLRYVFIAPALDLKIAVLLSAMPVAVATFILADKWKSDSEFVAANIVLTTILALATLSMFFVLFP